MGIGFNWFKSYRVIEDEINYGFGRNVEYKIEYLEGNSTSHAYGNRTKLQNIFRKYLNIEIPTIEKYGLSNIPDLNLIEPCAMSKYCTKLLNNKKYDLEDMTDRIQWLKEISDEGYYVSYDFT